MSYSSALDGDDDCQDDQRENDDEQRHQLDILPPHLPLEPTAAHAELARAPAQAIGLVDEEIDALAALEQALDIPRHDAPYVVDLALDVGDGVVAAARGGAVLDHEVLEGRVEAAGAVVGQVGEVGAGLVELAEEARADLEEEPEGHAPPQGRVRDHEEGQPARRGVLRARRGGLGYVVDVVVAVRVGQLLRRVVGYLGEDQRGERGCLRRGGCGALGEDGGVVRYARAGQNLSVSLMVVRHFIVRDLLEERRLSRCMQ